MMISSQRSGRIYLVENSPGITKMGKSIWYLSWEDGGAKFHLVLNFLVCTRLSLRSLSMFKFSSSLAKYIVHTYMWRLIWKYQKRRYLFGTGYLVLTYTQGGSVWLALLFPFSNGTQNSGCQIEIFWQKGSVWQGIELGSPGWKSSTLTTLPIRLHTNFSILFDISISIKFT